MKLLTVGNTKTIKGEGKGYRTFILHLAPADLSGYNVCPAASKGCRAACLNTAGRGRFTKTQAARVRKTRAFFEARPAFMDQLVKDIEAAIRNAERDGLIPVFRLNGTSDIRWETVPVKGHRNIMEMFPSVQFYDYTKLTNRVNLPSNYHLTFSRSESPTNQANVNFLKGKVNIAVVFATKKGAALPSSYLGLPVVDGDDTDLRFLDPHGVIVGLRGKGDAKNDSTNFVVAA